MKRIIIALLLAVIASTAYAFRCTTQTYIMDGRVITCQVCCDDFGNCTTSCF